MGGSYSFIEETSFADGGRWGNKRTAVESVEMKARNWPKAEKVQVAA